MSALSLPPRQVCPLCAHDDGVTVHPAQDGWQYACAQHSPPYVWLDHAGTRTWLSAREGIAAELGAYDDVFLCLSPGEPWLEHGIVEYRYKDLRPKAYQEMIDRWGHVIQGPRRYSVTAFLARTWGQLAGEGLLAWQSGPATGLYHYNGRISYWALPPGPEPERIRTWVDFAADLGISPYEWVLAG